MMDQDNGGRNRSPADLARPTAERAGDVVQTAKEDVKTVVGEAGDQAKRVAHSARERIGEQARGQQDQVAGKVRELSGQLREMAQDKGDSPVATVATRVADRGERLADYLAERGPEGLVTEVRDFARRKPGTFLLAAVAAGFVAGRVGKGIFAAQREDNATTPGNGAVPNHDTAVGVAAVPAVGDHTPWDAPVNPISTVTPGTPTYVPATPMPPTPAQPASVPSSWGGGSP